MMIGHILESGANAPWLMAAMCALGFVLLCEHLVVKHGCQPRLKKSDLAVGAVGLAAIVASVVVIAPIGQAGQRTSGLPDLISDPPRPASMKELVNEDGSGRLVFTFDGYVHNIGDGPLDVVGNPQLPDGMTQRVLENGEWSEVSNPTVRFEVDDGHNHFHLIEAVDYVLWDGAQDAQTAVGSKIGFCLVDSEQMEPGADQSYSEEGDKFCEEDNPGATSLRMGISAGWRDIYDSTTTLQWVDISDTVPGRYWIGAITDPNDEIVESNEDNNALVFADRPAIVPGWVPQTSTVSTDGDTVEIVLSAEAFGTVAAPLFRIDTGPSSGTLDVPTGASITDPVVRYTPDAGFTGTDQIVFSVRDANSQYPLTSPTASVSISVTDAGPGLPDPGPAPGLLPSSTFFEMAVGESFSTDVTVTSATDADTRLLAIGLPEGLVIDGTAISGIATKPGFADAELVAVDESGATTTQQITIIVNPAEDAGLVANPDRSSPLGLPLEIQIGSPRLGASFEAVGLPPGVEMSSTSPVLLGTPSETGSFDVEVTQIDVDDDRETIQFRWDVRPAIAIRFPI